MKKLFTFLFVAVLALCGIVPANAQYSKNYLVNENFDGLVALPATLTAKAAASGGNLGYIGRSAGITVANDFVKFDGGSGGGNRGAELQFESTGERETVYVEYDWSIVGAQVTSKNSIGTYLLGSKSTTDPAYNDLILAIYAVGETSTTLHIQNLDVEGEQVWTQGGSLIRCGGDVGESETRNASTQTNVVYSPGKSYHIYAELNFSTKKVVLLTITDKVDPTNTATYDNLPFVSSAVTDLYRIGINQSRGGDCGNGYTVNNLNTTLDNFQVYEMIISKDKEDVLVSYQDFYGNAIANDRIVADQPVGIKYALTNEDKASIIRNNNYYAYSAAVTDIEEIVVTKGGDNELIAKFKNTPLTAGTYVWKGSATNIWDELDENFSTDGTNRIGYQKENGVAFSDEAASNKDVNLTKNTNLGGGNLTISAEGYSLSGAGILSGTGSLIVYKSATINLYNSLSQGVELNGGTLEVKHANAAKNYVVNDGTTLNINSGSFSTPITGFGGTFTIIPTSQITQTSTITGIDVLKYSLVTKGNVEANLMNRMPIFNNNYIGAIEVSTTLDEPSYFATSIIDQSNSKLKLGENVRMIYGTAPANTNDDATATSMTIGELSGAASSSLAGSYIRRINYKVGSLNTNATFAGAISPANGAVLSIYKVGTGKWTLSGQSPEYTGNLYVNSGELIVTGSLASEESMGNLTVDAGAKLSGTGVISVNNPVILGALAGSLTFDSPSVTMEEGSTLEIVINGESSNKITTRGEFKYGGKLVVTAQNEPAQGTYKIIDAAEYTAAGEHGFNEVQLPSDKWSFNFATGELVIGVASGINTPDSNKTIKSVEYFNVAGAKVEPTQKGFVIKVTKYTDGSSSTSKEFQKQ